MARIKRELREQKVIRQAIEENGLTYVMINNKIIDLYKKGYYEYPIKQIDEHGNYTCTGEFKKVKFDSRNFALYIGLQFLNKLEFWCYIDEIANFMGWSVKRTKDRLKELQEIYLPMNNRTTKGLKKELLDEPRLFPLVKKHNDRGFEANRKHKTYRWYTPFDCDLKEVKNPDTGKMELKAHKFFMVTIYDLDLLLKKTLDDDEFALYLYIIQTFNSSDKEKKGLALTTSKIAENMRVKDPNVIQKRLNKLTSLKVEDKFWDGEVKNTCPDGFPLIHTTKPKNYNMKLLTRNEASLYYYPIYNDTTIQKINDIEVNSNPNPTDCEEIELESSENKMDTELNKMDSHYSMDTDFDIWDANSSF